MERIELKTLGENDYFVQEAIKVLRTNLQFCGKDVQVIAFTSCRENEGKSTISLCVARSFAEMGKKVLVVDADMRKSVMAGRHAGVRNTSGLSEVLSGMKELNEAICETQYPNLQVLFAGKYPPNPVELLGGPHFAALLEEARARYDYVIVDTPPVGIVIDAAVVAPLCDGVTVVMNDRRVKLRDAREAVEQLKKTGGKILGVVMNNTKAKQGSYYYGKNQ